MNRCRAALLALVLACPSIATAGVMQMTFDTGESLLPWQLTYVEDGITAHSDWFAPGGTAGQVNIAHASGLASAATYVDITVGDSLFAPISFDLLANGSGYCLPAPRCTTDDGDPIPYIWMSGYLQDAIVSEIGLFRPKSDVWETISLSLLGQIDRLRFSVYWPSYATGGCDLTRYCGMFSIDNITVQSVPEPETVTLLALGGLAAFLARRRKTN